MESKLKLPFIIALIGVILLIFLGGCNEIMQHEYNVIIVKNYLAADGWGSNALPMPSCICEYGYIPKGFSHVIRFMDSCNKYNIGDTIK